MTTIYQSLEGGGALGTRVQLADAATGDTAFNTQLTALGDTRDYDNTHFAHGTRSARFATGTTAGKDAFAWSNSLVAAATANRLHTRAYFYLSSWPTIVASLLSLQAGTTNRISARVNADGTVSVLINGQNVSATSTWKVPTESFFRLELSGIGSTTVGTYSCSAYYADGLTAIGTISASAVNTGGTLDSAWYGITTSTASVAPFWMDSCAASDVAMPDPVLGFSGWGVPIG